MQQLQTTEQFKSAVTDVNEMAKKAQSEVERVVIDWPAGNVSRFVDRYRTALLASGVAADKASQFSADLERYLVRQWRLLNDAHTALNALAELGPALIDLADAGRQAALAARERQTEFTV